MNQIVHIQDIQYDAIKYTCSEKTTTVKTNIPTISNSLQSLSHKPVARAVLVVEY